MLGFIDTDACFTVRDNYAWFPTASLTYLIKLSYVVKGNVSLGLSAASALGVAISKGTVLLWRVLLLFLFGLCGYRLLIVVCTTCSVVIMKHVIFVRLGVCHIVEHMPLLCCQHCCEIISCIHVRA